MLDLCVEITGCLQNVSDTMLNLNSTFLGAKSSLLSIIVITLRKKSSNSRSGVLKGQPVSDWLKFCINVTTVATVVMNTIQATWSRAKATLIAKSHGKQIADTCKNWHDFHCKSEHRKPKRYRNYHALKTMRIFIVPEEQYEESDCYKVIGTYSRLCSENKVRIVYLCRIS